MEKNRIKKKQILDLCHTCLNVYLNYLDSNNLLTISQVLNLINNNDLETLENMLIPIVEKIWDLELKTGNYKVISWNKYASLKEPGDIVFATLSYKDDITSFCDMTDGVEYAITFKSLLGACPKDGATILEKVKNAYTIGKVNDKYINSYNHATKLITPYQLINYHDNTYYTKYNELILDAHLINKIGYFSKNKN